MATFSISTGEDGEVRQLRTLYRLLTALSRAHGVEEVYEIALGSLLEATFADRAAILLFEEDGVVRFKASRGLSAEYQAAVTGHSPWTKGTLDAKTAVVPDALRDESLVRYHALFQREGIRALAFLPLALDAGVFGKCVLYYDKPHKCTPDERDIAEAIAAHIALATEHKRVEFACASSERRLQAFLDNSPNVVFFKNLDGTYQHVNRRWEELFQVRRADVVGRNDSQLFPRDLADRFAGNDRAMLESGGPIVFEESVPLTDGPHSYLCTLFPLKGHDGAITAVCGVAADITERKQLEIASQRLAAIVESSNDAIVGKNLNGIITSWNQGAERIFGYTAAEALGKPVAMLAAPDYPNEMPAILSKIRRGERVEHYETRRRRKDGEIIDVALTISPLRDRAGEIIGASKIARDITERKAAEKERAVLFAREREARRTAELLNTVGPRLAANLDPETLVQEVTDIATLLVGAEFGSFCHNIPGDKGASPEPSCTPRDAVAGAPMPRYPDLMARTFRGDPLVRCDDITQDPGCAAAPDQKPVHSYLAVPVLARSGEVIGGLFFGHSLPGMFTSMHEAILVGIAAQAGVALDNARLFEQAQWAQNELKRSNEELRRANRDLEVFAYSASHDLREPMRNIAISAQLLERSWAERLQGEDALFLSNIISGSQRMFALIDDLIAYTGATKYEEGATTKVASAEIFVEVLERLRQSIEESGAIITRGEMPAVSMHKSRFSQLLQNLIGNAIKYRNKDVPRIHVWGELRDGWSVFSVTDNGIGIESQFAEQIFGLFKRLHGRKEYPGSGIGLAICQRVVEQYGGRIWLERSAPGEGSTFCFAVPIRS